MENRERLSHEDLELETWVVSDLSEGTKHLVVGEWFHGDELIEVAPSPLIEDSDAMALYE